MTLNLLSSSYSQVKKYYSPTCTYELNTKQLPRHPTFVDPVNCVDILRNEYTCEHTTCTNYLSPDGKVSFENCYFPDDPKETSNPDIFSYQVIESCSKIKVFSDLSYAVRDEYVVLCPFNKRKNVNNKMFTCEQCELKGTVKPPKQDCKKLP
ncbi:hypothetical protein O181_023225 [Austropuccinia psidii MF-1]|uniref:Uncharacterized protein n=1 Tax=Austropuccinia psidii MF-1 TaxID=1389203 RepID=A0A9Q3CIR9_9BASI|nr:hypothetical protein [Austropuccinia psidii MF-1]